MADGFSAFVLSATVEEGGLAPQEQKFFEDVVKYSSLLWYYLGKERERTGAQSPWQGEHAPDLKRFRNSFCIIAGIPHQNSGKTRQIASARSIRSCSLRLDWRSRST